jgi:hypothetical protein
MLCLNSYIRPSRDDQTLNNNEINTVNAINQPNIENKRSDPKNDTPAPSRSSTHHSLERKPNFAESWSTVDLPKLLSRHQTQITDYKLAGNVDAIYGMECQQAEEEEAKSLLYDKDNLKRKRQELEDAKTAKLHGPGIYNTAKRRKINVANLNRMRNRREHHIQGEMFGNEAMNRFCIFTRFDLLPKDFGALNTTCNICKEALQPSSDLTLYPACGHYSHLLCAKQWFDIASSPAKCPLCGTDFDDDRLVKWQSAGSKVVSTQVQQIDALQAHSKHF